MTIYQHIDRLIAYALAQGLIEEQDKSWAVNALLSIWDLLIIKQPEK